MQNRKDGYRNFREKNELGVKKEDFCWKHRNPLKLMTLLQSWNFQICPVRQYNRFKTNNRIIV